MIKDIETKQVLAAKLSQVLEIINELENSNGTISVSLNNNDNESYNFDINTMMLVGAVKQNMLSQLRLRAKELEANFRRFTY